MSNTASEPSRVHARVASRRQRGLPVAAVGAAFLTKTEVKGSMRRSQWVCRDKGVGVLTPARPGNGVRHDATPRIPWEAGAPTTPARVRDGRGRTDDEGRPAGTWAPTSSSRTSASRGSIVTGPGRGRASESARGDAGVPQEGAALRRNAQRTSPSSRPSRGRRSRTEPDTTETRGKVPCSRRSEPSCSAAGRAASIRDGHLLPHRGRPRGQRRGLVRRSVTRPPPPVGRRRARGGPARGRGGAPVPGAAPLRLHPGLGAARPRGSCGLGSSTCDRRSGGRTRSHSLKPRGGVSRTSFRRGAEAILAAAGELGVLEQLEAAGLRSTSGPAPGCPPVPERRRPRARGPELSASSNVESGFWRCHGCGARGRWPGFHGPAGGGDRARRRRRRSRRSSRSSRRRPGRPAGTTTTRTAASPTG